MSDTRWGPAEGLGGMCAAVLRAGLAALVFGVGAPAAQAQVVVSYTPATANQTFENHTPPCVANSDCADFPAGSKVQGTFTLTSLQPNLVAANVVGSVTSYTVFDGLTTYASGDSQSRLGRVEVTTDAAGVISTFVFNVERWRTAGAHTIGDSVDRAIGARTAAESVHNAPCNVVGASPHSGVPDYCLSVDTTLTDHSRAAGAGAVATAVVPPAQPVTSQVRAVPGLQGWALVLAVLLVAGAGLWRAPRRTAWRRR